MNLNDRISRIIQYTGLTSSEFADEIDVQRSSVSHITSGRNKPSLDFLIKVKDRFPELNWEWLIVGEGNMTSNTNLKEETTIEEKASIPLHDLFAVIDNDDFGIGDDPKISQNQNSREFPIPQQRSIEPILNDSQQLEDKIENSSINSIDNQIVSSFIGNKEGKKLKKVLLLFDDGSFETYES